MGDGAAENEAARLDACHLVDLAARPGVHQFVDGSAKGARIAKKRGDVAKHDARLGIVRDVADRGLQIVARSNVAVIMVVSPKLVCGTSAGMQPAALWRTTATDATRTRPERSLER